MRPRTRPPRLRPRLDGDELTAEGESGRSFEPDEFLVDTFAGFLLMPRIAVLNAFARPGWRIEAADPEQFFVVSCSLGVGFETLASHFLLSLGLIDAAAFRQLTRKPGLPAIRRAMLGDLAPARLLVADTHHTLRSIDTEVDTGVLLPAGTEAEGAALAGPVDTPRRQALHRCRARDRPRVSARWLLGGVHPGHAGQISRLEPVPTLPPGGGRRGR